MGRAGENREIKKSPVTLTHKSAIFPENKHLWAYFFFPFDLKINTSLHTPWLCTVGSLKSHLPIPCMNSTSNDDGQRPETT